MKSIFAFDRTKNPPGTTLFDFGDGRGRIVAEIDDSGPAEKLIISEWHIVDGKWIRTKNSLRVWVRRASQLRNALSDFIAVKL